MTLTILSVFVLGIVAGASLLGALIAYWHETDEGQQAAALSIARRRTRDIEIRTLNRLADTAEAAERERREALPSLRDLIEMRRSEARRP